MRKDNIRHLHPSEKKIYDYLHTRFALANEIRGKVMTWKREKVGMMNVQLDGNDNTFFKIIIRHDQHDLFFKKCLPPFVSNQIFIIHGFPIIYYYHTSNNRTHEGRTIYYFSL